MNNEDYGIKIAGKVKNWEGTNKDRLAEQKIIDVLCKSRQF